MRALSMSSAFTIGAPLDRALAWCQSSESRPTARMVNQRLGGAKEGPGVLTYEVAEAHLYVERLDSSLRREPHRQLSGTLRRTGFLPAPGRTGAR